MSVLHSATRKVPVASLTLAIVLALSSAIFLIGCGGHGHGGTSTTPTPTPTPSTAQEWTWISGSSTVTTNGGPSGVYGTMGLAATSNVPGGRHGAVSWFDSSGKNLWLFGGDGVDSTGTSGDLNDLWEFNPTAKTWVWISGSRTEAVGGIYGAQGVATASTVPGSRTGAVSWIDGSGNLWLFGGNGFQSTVTQGLLNDLWEFSPTAKTWTWVSGRAAVNTQGIYGLPRITTATSAPGSRSGAVSWTDSSGNLWLFGGNGEDSTGTIGALNDLWEFSPSAKTWTWMNGSNMTNAQGIYGTLGTAASNNVPGARFGAVSWIDESGNLWLFGGNGLDSTETVGILNDLWEFSPTNNNWTWMSGSNMTGAPGVYGTLGTAAASDVPGARFNAVGWMDAGNLWLFGGNGYDSTLALGYLNDLWEFSPMTRSWTWMGGSNTIGAAGVYGTMGVAAQSNAPGSRTSAVSWTDSSGNFWLFGGQGSDSTSMFGNLNLNDLWRYQP